MFGPLRAHARHASNRFLFDGFAGVHADRLYFDAMHLLDALVSETREYEAELLLGETYVDRLANVRVRLEEQRAALEAARAAPPKPVAVVEPAAAAVVVEM